MLKTAFRPPGPERIPVIRLGDKMKKVAVTTALCASIASTTAFADTTSVSRMKPDQLRNDMVVSSQSMGGSSSAGIIIPLLLLVVIAAAASSGGGGGHHYIASY